MSITILVESPSFSSKVIAKKGRIVDASYNLMFMMGREGKDFVRICKERGWSWKRIEEK